MMTTPLLRAARSAALAIPIAALAACSGDATDAGPADVADTALDAPADVVDAAPDGADSALDAPDDASNPGADWPIDLRPLTTRNLRIVDDLGRDVILRGVNITSLGEYWQGNPAWPPTMPTTDEDWAAMEAAGISVVRLVVHWSRIEPERDVYDHAYLDEVDAYVRRAAEHGIYTVIDMHQDAYSAFIYTAEGETCPDGMRPGKGWDGAPAWAVITDGATACTPGERNAAPAVLAAWAHFYRNTDGLRDEFAEMWGVVAERFAGRPEVAGYDLLNEPEVPMPAAEMEPLYDALLADTIAAIRAAEADAGAPFEQLLFVEPAFATGNPSWGFVVPNPVRSGYDARQVVSAPHNYAEAIALGPLSLTIEGMNTLYLNTAAVLGVPTWIGEHGFWDTSDDTVERIARFVADQDRHRLGGAWWQWRQPCGDPHSVDIGGTWQNLHLNGLDCPGDVDLGPTEPLMRAVSRGFARAAPGELTTMTTDLETGALTIEGQASVAGGELLAWTPTSAASHAVEVENLADVREEVVGDGRRIRATVSEPGAYVLRVVPR